MIARDNNEHREQGFLLYKARTGLPKMAMAVNNRDNRIFEAIVAACARGAISQTTATQLAADLKVIRKTCCSLTGSLVASIVGIDDPFTPPLVLWSEIVGKWKNANTCKNKLSAVSSALRHDPGLGNAHTRVFWKKSYDMAAGAVNKHNDHNVATKAILESMPDLTSMLKMVKTLSDSREDTLKKRRIRDLERLWLLVAARVPAKRDDWGELHIVHVLDSGHHDAKRDNYVSLPPEGPAQLVLNHFKTDKRGRFTENLPDDVTIALRTSLRKWPRKYMFVNEQDKPFVAGGTFGNWASRVMTTHLQDGHKTLTGLRRSWIRAKCPTMTRAERKVLAGSMLHSLEVQQAHYEFVMQ